MEGMTAAQVMLPISLWGDWKAIRRGLRDSIAGKSFPVLGEWMKTGRICRPATPAFTLNTTPAGSALQATNALRWLRFRSSRPQFRRFAAQSRVRGVDSIGAVSLPAIPQRFAP